MLLDAGQDGEMHRDKTLRDLAGIVRRGQLKS